MTRGVRVRPRAWADLAGASRSISQSVSPSSAARWRARIEAAIRALADDADIWPEADEAAEVELDLRCKPFDRRRHVYRILFTIEADSIVVHRVRYAAMDWLTKDDI